MSEQLDNDGKRNATLITAGESWQAVKKEPEKTMDEKIREFLVHNRNLPYPELMARASGNHDRIELGDILNNIPVDEKGNPIYPSNQKKYWKQKRKARRIK